MKASDFPAAALFDLDGVLLDTEPVYTRIWSDIERVYPTGVPDFALRIKGNTLPRILDTYFPDPDVQAAVKVMLAEREEAMEYPIFDGVMDFLEGLRSLHIPAAIVTSSGDAKMQRIARKEPEFMAMFRALVTDSCVTHSKPHPEPYLKGAEALGADPARCLVFEDSFAGIDAGHAAGCTVVAIATTNSRESLTGRAAVILDTLADLSAAELLELL